MNEIEKMRSDLERLHQRIEARQQHYITDDDPVTARMIGRKVELERALVVIEPMQAEVERLREDNQLLRRQNGSLTQQVIDREQERDQLKAALITVRDVIQGSPDNVYAFSEQSIAAHDAEVIERFLRTEAPRIDAGGPNPIDPQLHHCEWTLHQERERLHAAANQLRQQAKEQNHEA